MGNTLEERVDRLIVKSNQGPPQHQRGTPNGHYYGRNPYPQAQRPEGFPDLSYQEPRDDI